MLISYHIKAELCTLFDKVHKAFINSANAPSLYTFYRLPTVKPPPIQRLAAAGERGPPGTGVIRHDMAWHCRRPAAGGCRRLAAETRGDRAPMVPFPLLTPQTLLCAATPFGRAAKWELRELGSVRRAGYGILYCPEVSLRNLPRITVRGHPVQSANTVAAKSSASIKR